MWIDLNNEESKPMIHTGKDLNGKETDRIIIPAFNLYKKKVGDGNGRERITMHAYEFRTSPKMLKYSKIYFAKYSTKETPI